MKKLLSVLLQGFARGALFVGGPLGLAHLFYNRVSSVHNSLIMLVVFSLLYGLLSLGTALVGEIARKSLKRSRDIGVRWSRILYLLFLGWGYFLYALTYDQGPGRPLTTKIGMISWLLFLLVASGICLYFLARLVEVLEGWIQSRQLMRRFLVIWSLSLLALSVGIALAHEMGEANRLRVEADSEKPHVTERQAVDTGLKVVLVGLDGATWDIVEPLMAKGELPHFASMVREGVRADLETLPDANSAVIWSTLYTGKAPSEHEVLDFYRIYLMGMERPGIFPIHRTYFKEMVGWLERFGWAHRETISRFDLEAFPIWEILDQHQTPVGVVDGYYYSVPVPEFRQSDSFAYAYGLDGFDRQLADLEGSKKVAREKDREYFVQPPELFDASRPFLSQGDFYWQSQLLLQHLDSGDQPPFLNLYTHQPDAVQHLFWKWWQPELFFGIDDKTLNKNADEIPKLYRAFDSFLGELRERVGPDTVIVVASDHGHAPTLLHQEYFSQHRHGPPGLLLMSGGPVKRGQKIEATVYDLVPTLLHLFGLPVGDDLSGKVLEEALESSFTGQYPTRMITSYDLVMRPKSSYVDSGLNDLELEKLIALGYVRGRSKAGKIQGQ